MPVGISNTDGKFESSLDNITEELSWVKKQVQRELTDLQNGIQENQIKKSFFEKKEDKVIYNMDLVKQYLQSCTQKDEFQINSAVVMAVQIALESKGYEVGVIDGLLKKSSGNESDTEKAIKEFQKENLLRVDGVPGKKTIQKLLDLLGDIEVSNDVENAGQNNQSQQGENLDPIPAKVVDTIGEGFDNDTVNMIFDQNPDQNPEQNPDNLLQSIRYDEILKNKEAEAILKDRYGEEVGGNIFNRRRAARNKDKTTLYNIIIEERKKPNEAKQEDITKDEKTNSNNKALSPELVVDTDFIPKNWDEAYNMNILRNTQLKATDKSELGGIGSSIMKGFQEVGGFTNMDGRTSATTGSNWFTEGEYGELYYKPKDSSEKIELGQYCNDNGIKSFMFYFGGNEKYPSSREKLKNDIIKWGDYLAKRGIQPVLCTCIGENIKDHTYNGEYYLPELNSRIRALGREKDWPVIDFVLIDKNGILRKGNNVHPAYGDEGGYAHMAEKIGQYLKKNN